MCNTGLVYRIKANKVARLEITERLEEKMLYNPDGFGLVEVDRPSQFNILRTLEKEKAVEQLRSMDSKFLFYHWRLRSSGTDGENGIHFWNWANFLFAHNGGGISSYGGKNYKDDKMVDSQVYFHVLIETLKKNKATTKKAIAKIIQSTSGQIWGRFMLLDKKEQRVFFCGDWETYLVDKSYIVITSTDIDWQSIDIVEGLEFPDDESNRIKSQKINGVWVLDLKTGQFEQLGTGTAYDSFGREIYNGGYGKSGGFAGF